MAPPSHLYIKSTTLTASYFVCAVADRRKRSRRSSSAQSLTALFVKSATPPSAQWGCARFPSRNRPTSEFSRSSPRSLHTSHQAQGTKHKALLYAANGGAVSADITSANIVGYKTASVAKANYKAFSLNLADVNNPTAGVKIDKLFTIDTITAVLAWGDAMDQIWRWDTTVNKWAKYGYQQNPRGKPALAPAWRKYDAATGTFTELTDADVVLPGETFLYFRGGNATATLTLAGQVKEFTATVSYTIAKANYQFVAYPWPVEIKLSEISALLQS